MELNEKQQAFVELAERQGIDPGLFGCYVPEVHFQEERPRSDLPTILYIHTGGTLAMVPSRQRKEALTFEGAIDIPRVIEICHTVGYIRDHFNIIGLYLANIDSKDVLHELWTSLVTAIRTLYKDVDGVVVGHGTHTLEHSAAAASFCLRRLAIPIVFTASQIPLVGFPGSDGYQNLTGAMQIAAYGDLAEVVVYTHGDIFRGNRTTKKNDSRLDAFEARVTGPIGHFCSGGRNIELKPGARRRAGKMKYDLLFRPHFTSSVSTIRMSPGTGRDTLKGIFERRSDRGMILETYGSGALPRGMVELIAATVKQEFPVFITSSCAESGISAEMQGHDEDALAAQQQGIQNLYDMSTSAATVKLMSVLALFEGEKAPLATVRAEMLKNWASEISTPASDLP